MLSGLFYIGKYFFIISSYVIEHKGILVSTYSVYDLTKFSFYIIDKIGILDVISACIKKKYQPYKNVLLEIKGIENTDLGEFEIMDIY